MVNNLYKSLRNVSDIIWVFLLLVIIILLATSHFPRFALLPGYPAASNRPQVAADASVASFVPGG